MEAENYATVFRLVFTPCLKSLFQMKKKINSETTVPAASAKDQWFSSASMY